MTRTLATLVFSLLTAAQSYGQAARNDSSRVTWLRDHVVDLDSMMAHGSLPSELPDALEQSRIIAFGEATHGDGRAFEIRNALTRALHEEKEYDILALEATGLHRLHEALDPEAEPSAIVDSLGSWLWRSSEQARPGLLYAARTANTEHPLRLRGIDVQHSPAAAAALFDEVERAIRRAGVPNEDWPAIREMLGETFRNPFAPVDSSKTSRVTDRSREIADALRESEPHAAILLETALSSALVPWTQSMDPRDLQMGKNLVYLAELVYPGERIVVWGASSHLVRKLPAIDTLDPTWAYDGNITMGDIVSDSFGDDYYVVAFTACGGTYGAEAIGLEESRIEPPRDGSLEALACAVPFNSAAFVDLRGLSASRGGKWLSSPLLSRPLGYTFRRASWPIVLDALIVVRTMTPSTPFTR